MRLPEKIAGKKVLVLGLGRSGMAAARLLLRAGAASVIINDSKKADLLQKEIVELQSCPDICIVTGEHPDDLLRDVSFIIKSPGIKPRIPLLQEANRRGMEIYSELELAYHFCPVPLAAITGTNGKTTTTALAGEMFRLHFPRVQVAGNIGYPLSEAVLHAAGGDFIVAELSSFQLADIRDFRARVAAILNITPDHLDYHGTMAEYIEAKCNILCRQLPGDWSILNWDDQVARELAPFVRGTLLPFSRQVKNAPGVFMQNGQLVINDGCVEIPVCAAAEVRIPGAHNLENALAAAAVAWAAGVRPDEIAAALRSFPGVPHRLEDLGAVAGVKFINDSKGTNPGATLMALRAIKGPKILIAGGMNKGSDFAVLARSLAAEGVIKLILIGETATLLAEAAEAEKFGSISFAPDLHAAVSMAFTGAVPGDTILLSPACASWDMFRDFEQRGETFRQAVSALREGCAYAKPPLG